MLIMYKSSGNKVLNHDYMRGTNQICEQVYLGAVFACFLFLAMFINYQCVLKLD